jgi:alpha-N-arabinofuranosidase
VYELYGAHAGGRSVRSVFAAPRISYDRVNAKGSLWGLAGSASIKDRSVTLTVVNPHVTEPRDAEIVMRGASAASARATTISAMDIHAHNTFDRPREVQPREDRVASPQGGILVHRFAPASVTRLSVSVT